MNKTYKTTDRATMAVLAATCPVEDIGRFSVMTFDRPVKPNVLLVTLRTRKGEEYCYLGDGDSYAYWQAIGDGVNAKIHAVGLTYDYPMCDDKAQGEYWIIFAPIR